MQYPRDYLENHVVFCCLKFREVTIYFVKEKVPKTAQQDVKAFWLLIFTLKNYLDC